MKLYLFGALLLFYNLSAHAADISTKIDGNGDFREVVIEGTIERGDFERFIRIIEENQGEVSGVNIFSSGGDFDESMKIGRALHVLELSSQVPMQGKNGEAVCNNPELEAIGVNKTKPKNEKNCTCTSACFFIHIAAFHRGGTFLAVHRPYFEKGMFGQLSEIAAKKEFDALQKRARSYMEEMSVPLHIQESVLATSSDNLLLLDEKTVRTHFWGKPTYIQEWIRNKCSQIEPPAATDQYNPLETKENKELECAIKIVKERRLNAYKKYFGKEPNISNSHDFSKWANATDYLGKDFYKIQENEAFEEEESRSKYLNLTSLSRPATAQTPLIQLWDSEDNLRIVSEISLMSPKNPPPDFLGTLIGSLEKEWGQPRHIKETEEWEWKGKNYVAVLNKMHLGKDWLWQMKISAIQ